MKRQTVTLRQYWHTSGFLPTVLVHLRHKLHLSEYSRSRPFWHILCVFDRFDAPKAQSVLCLSVLEHTAQARTYTHFSLGNSISCADCTFYVLLSNMSRNLATVKMAFYNNHRLSWFWSWGRNECAPLWREGSCARRNAAIILRSQNRNKNNKLGLKEQCVVFSGI